MTTAPRMKDRNVIEDLTRNGFLANEDQIEALARYNLQNVAGGEKVRGVYLKTLIVAVQAEITGMLVEAEPAEVLDKVHKKFYAAVMRAVPKDLQDNPKLPREERRARAKNRNRSGNFARSAKSTVLSFIKADGDIMQLNAANITKMELAAFATAMKTPARVSLADRTESAVLRAEELLRRLSETDKPVAQKLADGALARFADLAIELGATETTNRSDVAMRDQKLLALPAGMFWPVLDAKDPIVAKSH